VAIELVITKLDPSTQGLVDAVELELGTVVWELLGGSEGERLVIGAGGRIRTEGRWSGGRRGDEPA
jgi:hypothetical protein